MTIIAKGVISGIVVSLVLLFAQSNKSHAAGIAVLFPAITLLSYYFIGSSEGSTTLRAVVRSSVGAFPIWLAFMAVVYFALRAMDFRLALALATLVWLCLAAGYLALFKG